MCATAALSDGSSDCVESEILDLCARILRETDARLDAKRGTSDQSGLPGRNAPAGILCREAGSRRLSRGIAWPQSASACFSIACREKSRVGITTSRGAWPRDFGTIRIRKLHVAGRRGRSGGRWLCQSQGRWWRRHLIKNAEDLRRHRQAPAQPADRYGFAQAVVIVLARYPAREFAGL